MLPQFIKTQAEVDKLSHEAMFEAMYTAGPLLLEINSYHQKEGQNGSFQMTTGEIEEIDFKKMSVEMSSPSKPGRGESIKDLLAVYTKGGSAMGLKIQQNILNGIEEATDKAGNVVSIKNGVITPEAFFEMLEKVEIDFDENGQSQSSWILPPEMAADLQKSYKSWQQDPVLMAKFAELDRKKKDQFHAREATRRLAR